MSVNTIVTTPSGWRSGLALPLVDDRAFDDATTLTPDGSVHDSSLFRLGCWGAPSSDDEAVVVEEEWSPYLRLDPSIIGARRVMMSRKAGRMVGSWCLHSLMRPT
jgi:hypothetical protein